MAQLYYNSKSNLISILINFLELLSKNRFYYFFISWDHMYCKKYDFVLKNTQLKQMIILLYIYIKERNLYLKLKTAIKYPF